METVYLSSALGETLQADVNIFPISSDSEAHEWMSGRLVIAINSGCSAMHLRPTADEARQIIAAMQRALDLVPA